MDYSLWGHNKLDTIEHTYTQRHALLKKKEFWFYFKCNGQEVIGVSRIEN